MENAFLGEILNNIVMEKAIRDKIIIQQKEQREEERLAKLAKKNEDQFSDDEETQAIMKRMRDERLNRVENEVPSEKNYQRTVGEYREVVATEFLTYVTKFKYTVVHFYHKEFERCKIMHKHLGEIALKHPQTQFLYINAENAPFFVQKLHIRTLPTLCLFIDGILKDKVIGFEGLSGDEFKTGELINKLALAKVITRTKDEEFRIIKGGKKNRNKYSSDEDNNSGDD